MDINFDDFDNDTKKFNIVGRYRGKCVDVYDGDTVKIVFNPLGTEKKEHFYKFKCRCIGYNSAEIRTNNQNEKIKAIESRDYLKGILLGNLVDIECMGFDKYGRILVDIEIGGEKIKEKMIKNGYGKEYDGHGKKEY